MVEAAAKQNFALLRLLHLIEQTEHPKRDFVAVAHFSFVNGQVTVFDILDLVEGFLASAYFEKIFPIHEKITRWGIGDLIRLTQLVKEESLSFRSYIGLERKSVHEVGFVEIYLLGS